MAGAQSIFYYSGGVKRMAIVDTTNKIEYTKNLSENTGVPYETCLSIVEATIKSLEESNNNQFVFLKFEDRSADKIYQAILKDLGIQNGQIV
jgi:hypothetical protein